MGKRMDADESSHQHPKVIKKGKNKIVCFIRRIRI